MEIDIGVIGYIVGRIQEKIVDILGPANDLSKG
jgi:F420-0:gamma-glutamyl ligase-like protein